MHLAFAFDIGDEIDLELARVLLQGELGQLPRRRRTPESIGYRPAPIRVPLEPPASPARRARFGAEPPRAELTLFDFGAISLAVRFPSQATPRALATGRSARRAGRASTRRPVSFLVPWIEPAAPGGI